MTKQAKENLTDGILMGIVFLASITEIGLILAICGIAVLESPMWAIWLDAVIIGTLLPALIPIKILKAKGYLKKCA